MVFSDLFFLYVFLPSFALLYLLGTWIDKSAAKGGQLSCRARNTVLVAFSFIFYAWGEPVYVFLMLVCVIINFFIGRSIDHQDKYRKAMLALGVACNLCILGIFKYAGKRVGIIPRQILNIGRIGRNGRRNGRILRNRVC